MSEGTERKRGGAWGIAVWCATVTAVLVGLPWATSSRLPERLATHWGAGDGGPDGSMPLWAAAFFPALVWVVLALLIVALGRWRGRATPDPETRGRSVPGLISGGVLLLGAQASIVRVNLDHAEWRQAGSVTLWAAVTLGAAVVAGLAEWAVARRGGL